MIALASAILLVIFSPEVWVKVTYDWPTILCLYATRFSLEKAVKTTTQGDISISISTRRMNLSVFLLLMLMSTKFSLAYTCACAYSYAYAYALVKTFFKRNENGDRSCFYLSLLFACNFLDFFSEGEKETKG